MMTRIIIADNDLDSHELIDDLIEINFQDAMIEHAVTFESFLDKLDSSADKYDLILYNLDFKVPGEKDIVTFLTEKYPQVLDRVICIDSEQYAHGADYNGIPTLARPFSLDLFGEVVKKVCVK
jgi:hypothetical protein